MAVMRTMAEIRKRVADEVMTSIDQHLGWDGAKWDCSQDDMDAVADNVIAAVLDAFGLKLEDMDA